MSRPEQGIAEEAAFFNLFKHGAIRAFLPLKGGECVLELVVEGFALAIEVRDALFGQEMIDGGDERLEAFLGVRIVCCFFEKIGEIENLYEVAPADLEFASGKLFFHAFLVVLVIRVRPEEFVLFVGKFSSQSLDLLL